MERLHIWYRRYIRRDCYECGGRGRIFHMSLVEWCSACRGTGRRDEHGWPHLTALLVGLVVYGVLVEIVVWAVERYGR